MKKLLVVGVFLLGIGIGVMLVNMQMSVVTSQKAMFSVVSPDEIREMAIVRYEDNANAAVTDKAVIDQIIDDLSGMELRRENGHPPVGDYGIWVYSTAGELLGMELYKSGEYLRVNTSKHGNKVYKVLNGKDFLRTIEGLEWNK